MDKAAILVETQRAQRDVEAFRHFADAREFFDIGFRGRAGGGMGRFGHDRSKSLDWPFRVGPETKPEATGAGFR
jgi:hypothetical protein